MAIPEPRLFGISNTNSNLDFTIKGKGGWGKNKFNNAFPVSLLCFLHSRGLDLPLIRATTEAGRVRVDRQRISVEELLGQSPEQCYFEFEGIFPGFHEYVDGSPNNSDVIVYDASCKPHVPRRPLEFKLTAVPDSTTLKRPREEQAPELVTRPLMVELLASNICMAFGPSRRHDINELLTEKLGNPNNWDWRSEAEMKAHLEQIHAALGHLIGESLELQQPMVVQPIWRTVGDSMQLDDDCFDVFCWTDFGLALLFLQSLEANIQKIKRLRTANISRESRSAIWLLKMLWDYSTAKQLTMSEVVHAIAYSSQHDKAGTFNNNFILEFLKGPELANPRIRREELAEIILDGGEEFLNPERRLDAAIFTDPSFSRRP